MREQKNGGGRGSGGAADRYDIGLVADTHDVDDPVGVVEALGGHACDYNVHLGDIGGSRTVMNVVREFKRHLGDAEHLPPEQRREYLAAIGRGTAPLRAYIETSLGNEGLGRRIAETGDAYREVLAAMARLRNPVLIHGNVDGMQLRMPHIQACFAGDAPRLVTRPGMIDLGWLALILWPSWRPAGEVEKGELAEAVGRLTAAAAGKTHVVVLAHEHCFKGPGAAVYAERVARAGLQQLTVPRFDPNPTWRALLQVFRGLPAGARCCYVFGHVHDTAAVMAAGAPALRNPAGPGLRYRLYGLGWRGERNGVANGSRRSITMLPVAVDEVAVLRVERGHDEIAWQVVGYERGEG